MLKKFKLSILTPNNIFFDNDINQLNIEIANGRIGFLANHIPLISSIKTSRFSIIINDHKKEGVIIGGVLYMDGKISKIITSRIKWKEEINISHVESRIKHYKNKLKNETNLSKTEKKTINEKILYYQKQLEKD